MTTMADDSLETQIAQWRAYAERRPELRSSDGDELEDHLRDRIGELTASGLSADEAFLVAVKRMGSLDALTHEFAREHSERLWKQLVLDGGRSEDRAESRRVFAGALLLACLSALLVKIPQAFDAGFAFYASNAGLLALAPLAAYFCWSRRQAPGVIAGVVGLFACGTLAMNAYPLDDDGQAFLLSAIHLPIALWLVVGLAYTGVHWRGDEQRMDFLRFTGEWIVYFALIALGGIVLVGLTAGTFTVIGMDGVDVFISEWLVPCGAAGAVVIAAWLVEAKKGVVENMAPVLTQLFTPLFVVVLLALAGGILAEGGVDVSRETLILFDLVLVVVLGLLVYAISARDPDRPRGLFDRLQLLLVGLTLFVDAIVLVALATRIGELGFSANKTAALGENVILLVNLAWSARLLYGLIRNGRGAATLQRWQTRYLDVYAGWAWVVVLVFPVVFGFAT